MKKIPLTQGKYALVDDEDFERVSQYKWFYSRGYAVRSVRRPKKGTIFMHRFIMSTPEGTFTDHIDGNRSDNRKQNLRFCTYAQNLRNTSGKGARSGYKGVYPSSKTGGNWAARIRHGHLFKTIGTYSTKEEAAIAYNEAATEHFGEFARLNVIKGAA